jgi:hypothetical protein
MHVAKAEANALTVAATFWPPALWNIPVPSSPSFALAAQCHWPWRIPQPTTTKPNL